MSRRFNMTVSLLMLLGLASPALALPGYLYVSDAFGAIERFDPSGMKSRFASQGLITPFGIAFDQSGDLYVADGGSNSVERITPSGVVSVFASGLDHPAGLAFDNRGNLYVSNANGNTISKFTPNGVESLFSTTANNQPIGLAFDSLNNLYVANPSYSPHSRDSLAGTAQPSGIA